MLVKFSETFDLGQDFQNVSTFPKISKNFEYSQIF